MFDPACQLAVAAPFSGFTLLLVRAVSALAAALVPVVAAAFLLPGPGWLPVALLLPSLALSALALAAATGLLGPNGAGKTTLLSILATVNEPDAGRVPVSGLDPRDAAQRVEIRRRLGYLPQELGYHRHFTVAGFLDYAAILKEITGRRRRAEDVERADAERAGQCPHGCSDLPGCRVVARGRRGAG